MFTHLDDPAAPAADEEQLRAVLHRADRLAAARSSRHRLLAGGSAAVLFGAAVLAGVLGSGGTPAGPPQGSPAPGAGTAPEAGAASAFDRVPDPVPAGTAVPTTALTGVAFAGADHGFGLAAHRGRLVLASTSDGGAHWRAVGGRLPSAVRSASTSAGTAELQFTSATTGYLWSGPPAGQAGKADGALWTTDDGGRSWLRFRASRMVYDVGAIGSDAWAVVGNCLTGQTTATGCSLRLATSTDGGAVWDERGWIVPSWSGTGRQGSQVALARATPTEAYVVAAGVGQPAGLLMSTDDGGLTWQSRTMPCAAPFDMGAQLAVSGTDDLWLVCGGQGTAGNQMKALYRSSDGGASWRLAADSTGPHGFSTPPPSAGVGYLPAQGYVAPYTAGHRVLAVASPTTAWLFADRGQVVETTDGGATWRPVRDLEGAGLAGGAPGNLTFVSGTTGWVAEEGVGLWHTVDGVRWRRLGR
ncbi:MAG TPA: hypothetical protein VHB02_09730 [Acidimicrobiales bacterium]|nr:hypothetical protein [Acidimicrobiales bacterium]